MSLSARCPACATLFKVVPDQLKVSDGWVRCGQCGEVFDAHAPTPSTPGEAAERPGPMPETDAAFPGTPAAAESGDARLTEPVKADLVPVAVTQPETAQPASQHENSTPIAEAMLDEAPAIGFLADADPARRRRKVRVRRGMGLAALLLAALLVLQVVYFQRDRLAASAPALQPALVALCELARCTLAPLRQIESVSLDSSSFTQLRPDAFRLSFVLKNGSQTALAMPALEITLTDNQDRAVARRVVLPAEFAPPSQPLAAGGEFAGSLVLGVASDTPTAATAAEPRSSGVTGYRVLAFYP